MKCDRRANTPHSKNSLSVSSELLKIKLHYTANLGNIAWFTGRCYWFLYFIIIFLSLTSSVINYERELWDSGKAYVPVWTDSTIYIRRVFYTARCNYKFLINPVFICVSCIKYKWNAHWVVFTLLSFDKLLLWISFSYREFLTKLH